MVSPTDKASGKGLDPAGQSNEPVSMSEVLAAVAEAAKGKRVQQSFYMSEEVKERIRSLVYWSRAAEWDAQQQGKEVDPGYLASSLAASVERGIWWYVLSVERELNNGEPFPPARGKLPTGPSADGVERLREYQRGKQEEREEAKGEGDDGPG